MRSSSVRQVGWISSGTLASARRSSAGRRRDRAPHLGAERGRVDREVPPEVARARASRACASERLRARGVSRARSATRPSWWSAQGSSGASARALLEGALRARRSGRARRARRRARRQRPASSRQRAQARSRCASARWLRPRSFSAIAGDEQRAARASARSCRRAARARAAERVLEADARARRARRPSRARRRAPPRRGASPGRPGRPRAPARTRAARPRGGRARRAPSRAQWSAGTDRGAARSASLGARERARGRARVELGGAGDELSRTRLLARAHGGGGGRTRGELAGRARRPLGRCAAAAFAARSAAAEPAGALTAADAAARRTVQSSRAVTDRSATNAPCGKSGQASGACARRSARDRGRLRRRDADRHEELLALRPELTGWLASHIAAFAIVWFVERVREHVLPVFLRQGMAGRRAPASATRAARPRSDATARAPRAPRRRQRRSATSSRSETTADRTGVAPRPRRAA